MITTRQRNKQKKEYYRLNKEKVYLAHRRWAEKNKERLQAYRKSYWAREDIKKRRRQYYQDNKEHLKKRDKQHYERTKDRHRELGMAKRYGISVEEYRELFVRHSKRCAICGNEEQGLNRCLAVDHNHNTGKVRGLLCSICNRGIGNFKEDINIMKKAIKYLQKYNAKTT